MCVGGRDSAREAGRESECEREGGSTMRPLVICTCVALVVLVRLTMFSVFLAVLFTVLYFCVFILFYFVFCLLALVSLLTACEPPQALGWGIKPFNLLSRILHIPY